MSVIFQTNIQWPKNQLLLPAVLYNIQIPTGLSKTHIRAPNFVNVSGMSKALKTGIVSPKGRSLSLVNGLVTTDIKIRFSNVIKQWRRLPFAGNKAATHGPCQFQFTGGVVFLDLTLGIYILNTNKPISRDPISDKIFETVYSHELLHLIDSVNTLKWLLSKVKAEKKVARYLVQVKPFVYGTRKKTIAQIEKDFHRYIHTTIHSEIHNLFAKEVNRLTAKRDSPAEYKKLQQRIDTLRASYTK